MNFAALTSKENCVHNGSLWFGLVGRGEWLKTPLLVDISCFWGCYTSYCSSLICTTMYERWYPTINGMSTAGFWDWQTFGLFFRSHLSSRWTHYLGGPPRPLINQILLIRVDILMIYNDIMYDMKYINIHILLIIDNGNIDNIDYYVV